MNRSAAAVVEQAEAYASLFDRVSGSGRFDAASSDVQVRRKDDRWWWTPPPWVDTTGRERPGGRVPPLGTAA